MAARTKKPVALIKTTELMKVAREGEHVVHFEGMADEGEKPHMRDFYVAIDKYRELGSPETITVTIEIGDTLNA